MFACLFQERALESPFTDYKCSFSASLSELTTPSRPSQGRSHALLKAINLRERSRTSSHATLFLCPHFLLHMINTLSHQISYLLLPLHSSPEHKQTQVDRLICFLYKSLILSKPKGLLFISEILSLYFSLTGLM